MMVVMVVGYCGVVNVVVVAMVFVRVAILLFRSSIVNYWLSCSGGSDDIMVLPVLVG